VQREPADWRIVVMVRRRALHRRSWRSRGELGLNKSFGLATGRPATRGPSVTVSAKAWRNRDLPLTAFRRDFIMK
jgi:hypothetical protein